MPSLGGEGLLRTSTATRWNEPEAKKCSKNALALSKGGELRGEGERSKLSENRLCRAAWVRCGKGSCSQGRRASRERGREERKKKTPATGQLY